MAEKNATFLQHWYRGYLEDYRRVSWNYNALELPVKLVEKFPSLIHIEGYNFTRPSWRFRALIYSHNYNWSTNYAMHLFLRFYTNFTDENTIRYLNTTIGAISRHVIFGNKNLCKNSARVDNTSARVHRLNPVFLSGLFFVIYWMSFQMLFKDRLV